MYFCPRGFEPPFLVENIVGSTVVVDSASVFADKPTRVVTKFLVK